MGSGGTLPLRTGRFTSDGNAKTIETPGFRPLRVELMNESNAAVGVWQDSMPDDSVRTSEGGTDVFSSADGVTPIDEGFILGTNAVLNTDTEIIHWAAFG